jgi:hypothetical protein
MLALNRARSAVMVSVIKLTLTHFAGSAARLSFRASLCGSNSAARLIAEFRFRTFSSPRKMTSSAWANGFIERQFLLIPAALGGLTIWPGNAESPAVRSLGNTFAALALREHSSALICSAHRFFRRHAIFRHDLPGSTSFWAKLVGRGTITNPATITMYAIDRMALSPHCLMETFGNLVSGPPV